MTNTTTMTDEALTEALASAWDSWRAKDSWDRRGQSAWYASPEAKAILGLGANDRVPQSIKRLRRRDLKAS